MPTEQELKDAKEQAVSAYLRGADKTSKVPPGFGRNVIGIGIGPNNHDPNADRCVHCYVERKLDPGAIPEGFLIKKTFGSVETNVIETRRFVAFQSAAPGSSIGLNYMAANVDPTLTGTLGGFVKVGNDYYVIGSNHAMTANGRVPAGTRILFKPPDQFIDDPSKYIFARTTVYVPLSRDNPNHVDCALAKVDPEDLERVRTEFPEQIVDSDPILPALGMRVYRVDDIERATGSITGVNIRIPRIDYRFGTYEFDNLVLIKGDTGQFARPGDSGAILVDQATNRATALVIGGSSKYTIACPLATAFSELEAAIAEQNAETQPTPVGLRRQAAPPPKIELIVNPLGRAASGS